MKDSIAKLDEKVRFKNPSNIGRNLIRNPSRSCSLRSLTCLELKKPGMAAKNEDSASSLPRASSVETRIRTSISDDSFRAFFSAVFSIPSKSRV